MRDVTRFEAQQGYQQSEDSSRAGWYDWANAGVTVSLKRAGEYSRHRYEVPDMGLARQIIHDFVQHNRLPTALG